MSLSEPVLPGSSRTTEETHLLEMDRARKSKGLLPGIFLFPNLQFYTRAFNFTNQVDIKAKEQRKTHLQSEEC